MYIKTRDKAIRLVIWILFEVQTGGSVCFVCQANCRLADVTHDPKPEIKAYFGEPLECLREALGRIGKIAQFQNGQQQRYISLMRKLVS